MNEPPKDALAAPADLDRQARGLLEQLAPAGGGLAAAAMLLDGQPIPVLVLGADHRLLFWNRAMEELTGARAEEVVGTNEQWRPFYKKPRPILADLLLDNDAASMERLYQGRGLGPSTTIPGAWRASDSFVDLNGRQRELYFLAAPLVDPSGRLVGAVETLLDITRLAQVSQALAASEERYRLLFDQVADGLAVVQDGRVVMANRALAEIGGASDPAELVGQSVLKFVEPSQREAALANLREVQEGREVRQVFQTLLTGLGDHPLWLEGHSSRITWEGRPAVLAMMRDVTHRKSREKEMAKRAQDLKLENLSLKSSLGERYRFGAIVGKSPGMQAVYEVVLQAAASEAGVIVYGESGTGKELVARAVHEHSARKEGEFVAVNCGAVPEPLLESEFFGYQKGAFTGAQMDKHGFLDLADGGTLFLDEVGELPLDLQVKLLRAIERGEYTPLGSNKAKSSRFRVVAATNRKLPELVARGAMREDFFYRVHIVPIELPPLRDRLDDLPLLVDHFLREAGVEQGAAALPGQVMQGFLQHRWPGNVRELFNAVQRWMATGATDLAGGAASAAPGRPARAAGGPAAWEEEELSPLDHALASFEKSYLTRALEANRWNRGKTADLLGVSRKTLFRKMRTLGLGKK